MTVLRFFMDLIPPLARAQRRREVASILTDAQLAEDGPDWRP